MSGIPGLFHRTGQPSDRDAQDLMGSMLAAAAHRGPDGTRTWSDGCVLLGHQQLRALTEDCLGEQPLVDGARGLAITFDGRLDNREALAGRVGGAVGASSDASLVLAAYREWGSECPAHLEGDFVLAIWDRSRRLVFCARDRMGIKPFYYYLDAHRFLWGSEIGQVLAAGVPREPNEAMAAEYLAHTISSQTETLYRGVMRLPAAHAMTVAADRMDIQRYWQLDLSAEVRHSTDDEYAEHFRSVFDTAVRSRLRAAQPVGAYLSGGLDSSSVVGTAAALGARPETFSLVYPQTPSADESPYIDAVVARWGLVGHKVPVGPIDGAACRAHVRARRDVLDLPADHEGEGLSFAMRDHGMRVMLTGVGGDYGLTGSAYHYADLLRALDFRGLLRQVAEDSRHPDRGWSASHLFVFGLRPLIPQRWRTLARPLARRLGWVADLPDWMPAGFTSRVGLADRIRPQPPDVEHADLSRRDVWNGFRSGWASRLLETAERAAAEFGIDERHPFFDRRVVELVLAIPEAQRRRGPITKYVLRGAMGDRLPQAVHDRLDKADFSPGVPRAVEAVGGGPLFDRLAIGDLGWVDQGRVSEMYRRARQLLAAGDEAYCVPMFRLWMIAGVELWYRSVFVEGTGHAGARDTRAGEARRPGEQPFASAPRLSGAAAH